MFYDLQNPSLAFIIFLCNTAYYLYGGKMNDSKKRGAIIKQFFGLYSSMHCYENKV